MSQHAFPIIDVSCGVLEWILIPICVYPSTKQKPRLIRKGFRRNRRCCNENVSPSRFQQNRPHSSMRFWKWFSQSKSSQEWTTNCAFSPHMSDLKVRCKHGFHIGIYPTPISTGPVLNGSTDFTSESHSTNSMQTSWMCSKWQRSSFKIQLLQWSVVIRLFDGTVVSKHFHIQNE